MKTEYLTKFDDGGRRETTVINGVHYATDEERQMYIDDGYISSTCRATSVVVLMVTFPEPSK